jgi:dolichol-phosphate mannosyltransferase
MTNTGYFRQNNDKKPYLSIVLPVYNGESTIDKVLLRIKQILQSVVSPPMSYEIVVVDDGSFDGTQEILKRYEETNDGIRIISYKPNKGKGYAVKTGILASRGEIVMFVDGDLEASPYLIDDYIRGLESSDLVIGSRRHPLSDGHRYLSRRILSSGFRIIANKIVGIHGISDTRAGLKVGRGEMLKTIFQMVTIRRFAFDIEVIAIASLLNVNIREMPIIDENRSKGFKVREMIRMLWDLLKIAYLYKKKRWYQQQLQERLQIGSELIASLFVIIVLPLIVAPLGMNPA